MVEQNRIGHPELQTQFKKYDVTWNIGKIENGLLVVRFVLPQRTATLPELCCYGCKKPAQVEPKSLLVPFDKGGVAVKFENCMIARVEGCDYDSLTDPLADDFEEKVCYLFHKCINGRDVDDKIVTMALITGHFVVKAFTGARLHGRESSSSEIEAALMRNWE